MFFTVLEIQVGNNGVKRCIPVIYDNENDAVAKFFTICSVAAVSDLPYHAAFVLDDNGMMVKSEIFDRRA